MADTRNIALGGTERGIMGTQVRAAVNALESVHELTFVGSDEFHVPGWWLRVSTENGDLLTSHWLSAKGETPQSVSTWVSSITGPEVATRLMTEVLGQIRVVPSVG
jgi:hypothetical protein